MTKHAKNAQMSLDFETPKWPESTLFPLNITNEKRSVLQEIIKDVSSSNEYLVVTGFTSLGHIIDFFSTQIDISKTHPIKIVLGFEPEVRNRKSWGKANLEKEVKDYWIEQGYSLFKSGNVIKTIELIKKGKILFRLLDKLHAKIYVGDSHAILGSANFSRNGLTKQLEANIRISNNSKNHLEKQQYQNIKIIATNFWEKAKDYSEGMIALLQQLIKITQWQEALARAISELLEGRWFNEFPELYDKINSLNLWPSQKNGLGQAIYILQNQGCVLIADPTGSGKTKFISTLQLLLFHWLWETGRKDKTYNVTICPPLVKESWNQESVDIRFSQTSQISMGILSHCRNATYKSILKQIRIANILVIDEAHNFLNLNSRRSKSLAQHTSDFVILATATPINKKAKDLLRLIELLGVDNLNDTELKEFGRLKKLKSLKGIKEIKILREYIKKFIVRRTKKQLKELILHEPDKYQDKFGKRCQFPEAKSQTYNTGETDKDKLFAREITKLAKELKGVIYLRKIELSELELDDFKYKKYVELRLSAAKALTIFNIQSKIRSSRVALVEFIEGTRSALEYFEFSSSKTHSGNVIGTIDKHRKSLPKIDIPSQFVPEWLMHEEKYREVCENEIQILSKISNLAKKISDSREISKLKEIYTLFQKQKLIIAFDSTILTLDYLKKLIAIYYSEIECIVVTGKTTKDTALKRFELGSKSNKVLGLFSDCMSEGINLQQASTVFFLDMPSVLRIAEQRIGRIDRLDSPHKHIHIFWPLDSKEFALRTDRKLIKTSIDTESLIGTNFEIPNDILVEHMDDIIRPKEMLRALKEIENTDIFWEGIQDAFKPVHELYEGKNSLIAKEDYSYYKDVDASVKVKISIIKASSPWLFIATRGSKTASPRWFFINPNEEIFSDLSEVCQELSKYINSESRSEEKWLEETNQLLNKYLGLIQKKEIELLPNKRRRVLEVAKFILEKKLKNTKNVKSQRLLKEVLALFKPASIDDNSQLDYYSFSQQWLDILNPFLFKKRQNTRSTRKVICLNDLKVKSEYTKIELNDSKLEEIINNAPYAKSLWRNIASCIIGVPSSN